MPKNKINSVIVNDEYKKQFASSEYIVLRMNNRYKYDDGKKTDDIIGANVLVACLTGDAAGETYMIKTKFGDYQVGDRVKLNDIEYKPYAKNDYGYMHIAISYSALITKMEKK